MVENTQNITNMIQHEDFLQIFLMYLILSNLWAGPVKSSINSDECRIVLKRYYTALVPVNATLASCSCVSHPSGSFV